MTLESAMTAVPEVDPVLVDTVGRLFAERSAFEARARAEDDGWAPELWEAVAAAGLPAIGVPEDRGGAGGTVADAAAVWFLAGRHAAPVPLVETALATWLLAEAGLPVPEGPLTVAVPSARDSAVLRAGGERRAIEGSWARVPWAARAHGFVAVVPTPDGEVVAALDPTVLAIADSGNLAGEPVASVRADTTMDAVHVAPVPVGTADALLARGALARAAQLAGAMEAVAEITVGYAHARLQFGRPVAEFQAVQHQLVQLVAEAARARIAVEVAARITDVASGDPASAWLPIAAAKSVASAGAGVVAARAHQVHAAIGMTREYELHHFTRRLWTWRRQFGSDRHWDGVIGARLAADGPAALWLNLTTDLAGFRQNPSPGDGS
jgi:acyl-CoA dehydrogenase